LPTVVSQSSLDGTVVGSTPQAQPPLEEPLLELEELLEDELELLLDELDELDELLEDDELELLELEELEMPLLDEDEDELLVPDEPLIVPAEAVSVTRSSFEPSSLLRILSV
jgi:hypothetical protein